MPEQRPNQRGQIPRKKRCINRSTMGALTRWAHLILARKCRLRQHHGHMSCGLSLWNSKETADGRIRCWPRGCYEALC